MSDEKGFPVRPEGGGPGGWIPWWLAEVAFAAYQASGRSGGQTLEEVADQGGFSWRELGKLLSGTFNLNGHFPVHPTENQRRMLRTAQSALQEAWRKAPKLPSTPSMD